MLAKFGGVEFHVKKIDYGRSVKIAEASFLADDNKSQVNEPDNIDFKIQGFIYGREVENVKRRLEAALSRKQGLLVMPDGRSAQVKTDEGGWRISGDDENEGYYLLDLNFKKIDADNLSLQIIELKEIDEEKVAAGQAETEKNILAEFDEKFTFEGFPNFVKTQFRQHNQHCRKNFKVDGRQPDRTDCRPDNRKSGHFGGGCRRHQQRDNELS